MATRWAAWFAVSGDARFLSHHDTLRLMERAAMRADLPLKHSEGFNPRPRLSLPAPRPAGVASRCELLVMTFDGDVTDPACPRRLAGQFPEGIDLFDVTALPPGKPIQMESATYEMPLSGEEFVKVRRRLEELNRAERWTVRRASARGRTPGPTTELDVKDRIREIRAEGGRLSFALVNTPGGSARCAEALSLLGLCDDDRPGGAEMVARLTRTDLRGPDHPARNRDKELDT